MSSSAITTQVAQLKIGSIQNQADTSSIYSNGVWSFKNSTALTSVTITDAGNVGIGTTSPTFTFGKGAMVNNAGAATLRLNNSTASVNAEISAFDASYGLVQYTISNHPIVWGTNGTEKMRIDASGNLLVGTTTSPNFGKFASNGNSQVWTFGPNTANAFVVYCQPAVGGNFGVYLNAGATSWTANSDERLKDISGEIKDATGIIKSLRAVHYTLKADEQEIKTERIGLIAQEVKAVVPQIVDENEAGYLGVRYSEMVPVLVKAIQELSAKVDAQAEEIKALKAQP